MSFHPSINEEAKGFWGGYYKGLCYFLLACALGINLAIIANNFVSLPFDAAINATKNWYKNIHSDFYIVLLLLLFLSFCSYIVSHFIDKIQTNYTKNP